ncbi:MAG: hypothetical protein L3J71_11070 [Victivallaceae bacterium]|nr:hypothetical protein [Victivallaceae bacterium]
MTKRKMILQKLAGNYQFIPQSMLDITLLETLNLACWGAVNIPCATLNGDQKLFEYLDNDKDGFIKSGELLSEVKWLCDVIELPDDRPFIEQLKISAINQNNPRGAELYSSAVELLNISEPGTAEISLGTVREKQQQLSSGTMKGDGIIVSNAIADTTAAELAADIISSLGGESNAAGTKGITSSMLDKFLADAAGFIAWEAQKEDSSILPRGENTASAYESFSAIRSKIDEYFGYCELLQVDPAHEKRFKLSPNSLPELDLNNPAAIKTTIATAPLATPSPQTVLHLNLKNINPAYYSAVERFKTVYKKPTLSYEAWRAIKNEFAPYESYLNSKAGASVESLGSEKLNGYLKNEDAIKTLRKLFVLDDKLMNKLNRLRELEKLLLYSRYIVEFINSFVSFSALFSPAGKSMIEAGSLIMDGYHFELAIKVTDIAKHKNIAKRSNICILYVKLKTAAKPVTVAVAVTSGSINNLYIGKPGLFLTAENRELRAEIIDIIAAPVSIKEALALPFNKLGEFIEGKIDKFSSSKMKNVETGLNKQLTTIEKAQLPGTASKKTPISPLLIMGGGVGIAAVGSGFAFMVKSLKEVSWLKILLALVIIVAILAMPLIISAIIKLRRRNLGLLLEAAGWAVNLRLNINRKMGVLFTYSPEFPPQAVYKRRELIKFFLKQPSKKLFCPAMLWTLSVIAAIYALIMFGLAFFPTITLKIFELLRL